MRRNVMPLMTVALASAVLAPLPAGAANNPSAHQHGHAELQVAIDANTADCSPPLPTASASPRTL